MVYRIKDWWRVVCMGKYNTCPGSVHPAYLTPRYDDEMMITWLRCAVALMRGLNAFVGVASPYLGERGVLVLPAEPNPPCKLQHQVQ